MRLAGLRRATGVLLAALCITGMAGCISLGPDGGEDRTFYRLEVPRTTGEGPHLPATLAVRPFTESEALAREGIRYLVNDVEGGYWASQRWCEPVATMVQDAVTSDLDAAGIFRSVLMLEGLPSADFLLGGMVHRFEEQDREGDWFAVVEITFEVARARGGEVVYHRRLRAEERCEDSEVPELVRALGRALATILGEVRADLPAACAGG